uniref:SET domain-containing protein n=1 Tax=Pseudo-nitzschia australis TaxID=44445 RepID=A0A7S4ENI2_9STRA|mmetsp:Transcript_4908/g.10850  ORF Transcript_4908/g.10850 Transcript_4908/m.10850 type:complete len:522 (+) Transcript_4908:32-1597(+)
MTEVRCSKSGGHLGLFALKDFSVGDVILEEIPTVTLAPSNEKVSRELLSEWEHGSSKERTNSSSNRKTLWTSIKLPPSNLVPSHLHGTFKGMVQACIVFIKNYQDKIEQKQLESVLELYYPTKDSTSDAEKCIINVTDEAILFLKQHVTTTKTAGKIFSSFEDWDKLHKIALIWACNAFQGGRVYPQISRVNHSCNPNALIQTSNAEQNDECSDGNNEGQKLLAATKIEKGSEICISYLGLFLYTDTVIRRKKLERTKFFKCVCLRCTDAWLKGDEGAAKIPCLTSHPRDPKQMSLDEDVQYDDDQTVKYISLGLTEEKGEADDEKVLKVLRNVCGKIELYLDIYDDGQTKNNNNSNGDDEEEKAEILEEHASLASTMMGDRHWTTNLTLLLHLDTRLKAMSQRMIVTQELPEEDKIAEAIDSLQRIFQFVNSLELDMYPGHLLGDVTIGTARMLVSLGDEKSQKYGAEWLSKIDDYVDKFANKGVQKVVSVLKVAWKKHRRFDNDADGSSLDKKKKAKIV